MRRYTIPLMLLCVTFFVASAVISRAQTLEELYARLANPDEPAWKSVEQEIWARWSQSGDASADFLLMQGRGAMAAGDLLLAEEYLDSLVRMRPDFAEGWNARALLYFHMGDFPRSMQDISEVLTRNPNHFGALTGLGTIFAMRGQPEQALRAYEAAEALHPHHLAVKDAIQRLNQMLKVESL